MTNKTTRGSFQVFPTCYSPLLITLISICLFPIHAIAQADVQIKVDSVLSLPLDSTLSWMNKNYVTDTKAFPLIAKKAISKVKKGSNMELIGDFHTAFADWMGYHGLYAQDSLINQSKLALEAYKKTKNESKIAYAHRSLALDYLNARKIKEAENELFAAIIIFEKLNDEVGLASAYRTLGISYNLTKEPKKALIYFDKAAPHFIKAKDYNRLSYLYLNYIEAYTQNKEFQKAYDIANKCLVLVKEKVPDEFFVEIRAYMGRGHVSLAAENYKRALADYQKAHKLCIIQIGEERAATYQAEIGQAYLKLKNYPLALKNLLEGLAAYDQKQAESFLFLLKDIAECYEAMGDTKNALVYFKKQSVAKENIYKGKVATLEGEAIAKYESGKKDQAIIEQQELIDQKSKTQNIALASAGVLALLLGGLFISFRKNREKTKVITAKNAENELLLKEIHHRVKNNLELVKSLIALQSAELEDSATKDAMIASQNRVQSMGIIHQKLYQGTNLGSIEMKDYFINLSEGILDSFNAEEKVKIECAMDDLELDIDTAVPIGLIVNELLTNALKYAFPENNRGEIKISMSQEKGKVIKLNVSDNGIGKVAGIKPIGTGFGTRLVQLLTQQLNGEMQEENKEGTIISFTFKLDQAA